MSDTLLKPGISAQLQADRINIVHLMPFVDCDSNNDCVGFVSDPNISITPESPPVKNAAV